MRRVSVYVGGVAASKQPFRVGMMELPLLFASFCSCRRVPDVGGNSFKETVTARPDRQRRVRTRSAVPPSFLAPGVLRKKRRRESVPGPILFTNLPLSVAPQAPGEDPSCLDGKCTLGTSSPTLLRPRGSRYSL